MPVLKNPRWEAFAQARATGLPAYKAYIDAGFKVTQAAAFTNSWRLLRNAEVLNRVKELGEEIAERMTVTRESLALEYQQIAEAAFADGQYAAAKSAVEAKQSVLGLDATTKSLSVNVSATFNGHTDDELQFELASMLNEVRGAAGKQPVALPAPKEKQN